MKSQIYTPDMTRKLHIRQINEFVWPFFKKIIPQFSDIEIEADQISEDYWQKIMSTPISDDSFMDAGMYADTAIEKGVEHYMMLKLGLYTVTAAWHATLFEFFHQQVRFFLYNEFRHISDIEIKNFCGQFNCIVDFYKFHNFDITTLACWKKIDELRWLCNVIKHGDGHSADKLRELNPNCFKEQEGTDLFRLYKTTLLEETLNLNEATLLDYKKSAEDFWEQIPERCYSNEIPRKNST